MLEAETLDPFIGQLELINARMRDSRQVMNRYDVEIQKKFALAFACIVFVLIGAPIALRFPRGGVGLVIGASVGIFALYYIGLVAGEALADRLIMGPFLAMWLTNILFFGIGLAAALANAEGNGHGARRRLGGGLGCDPRLVRAPGAPRWHPARAEAHDVTLLHPLDRYVFREFWKIFVATAVGFPLLVIVFDLTEKLDKYLARDLSRGKILLSYVYWIAESMFMALPAAVLFATVFSIGALTRHSEITAAKASGISFHRLTLPIFLGAAVVAVLAGVLGEIVPVANARRNEILEERKFSGTSDRFNFTYAGEEGRVYKVQALNVANGAIDFLEVERKGNGPDYPTTIVTARGGTWQDSSGHWLLRDGQMHIVPTDSTSIAVQFDSLADNHFVEAPRELMAAPKTSQEMRYQELSRFILALERSGSSEVNRFKVEKALRIAVPVTCLIIAIFGAPLATSTQRGGAAYGIGVSLATTVIFLMLIQLTKAIGGGGLLPPNVAAWMPNAVFGVAGAILLARTRT